MYRTVFWTLWERARVGWLGRMALKHIYYHMWNESPVQVWCMRQGARGWCTRMTQRDGIGREMGGEFRMGNTCTPVADSCQCMAKPLQYCKAISLQLNKFILKKKDIIGFKDGLPWCRPLIHHYTVIHSIHEGSLWVWCTFHEFWQMYTETCPLL